VHVPLMQVPRRLDDIPDDRPVLVVCRVGSRSAQATGFLQAHGRDAVNLAGGMVSWHRAGLPMVCDGDADARVV
jgi:rhodanese-related sulfurtransferase